MARAVRKFAFIFLFITACLFIGKLFFSAGVFGHSVFVVNGGSMEPEYPLYSVVITKRVPFETLSEGDVIVFRSCALGGGLAFHRISLVTEEGVFTKGDNNAIGDNQLITDADYVGKGIFKSSLFARWLPQVRQPRGFILYFMLPLFCAFAIGFSLKRLRRVPK